MRYHPITQTLKRINPEIACIWNDVIDRWQVYSRTQGKLVLLNGQHQRNLELLWTIQADNGDYVDPGDADVRRMVQVMRDSEQLWHGNVDQICDDAEGYEARKERELTPAAREAISEVVQAAAWSMRKYGEIR